MRRIPSLDGLRAISITLVVLGHLSKWKHISAGIAEHYGAMGVFVFFVLSGYLITNLLLREYETTATISLKTFYLRRAFRIFPAAFLFLAVMIVLYWREMTWYHIAAAVFYVANMDITRPWMFGHLWSLGIEEQFYLLWPFAFTKWFRHRTAILVCSVLVTPLFSSALYAFRVHNALAGSLPVCASQLAIGCLLAVLAPRLPKIPGYAALTMLAAVFLIPSFPGNTRARTLFELFVLGPVMHVCVALLVLHVIQVPYRFLNWAPVTWLGRVSYSLYLWQEVFCSNPRLHMGYGLALFALGCATLSYYFVEQPMLRLRDRITRNMQVRSIGRVTDAPVVPSAA